MARTKVNYEGKRSALALGQTGGPATFNETSPVGPALAPGDGMLYLAWTGTDDRLNVALVGASG